MKRKTYKLTPAQALNVICALISVIGMDISDAISAGDPAIILARCRRASEAIDAYSALVDQRGWTDEASTLVDGWHETIADLRIAANRQSRDDPASSWLQKTQGWAIEKYGLVCPECEIAFTMPSPQCPHQITDVHPLSEGKVGHA